MAVGGRLYDNWAAAQGGELPETTHPAYPGDGPRQGSATWRCKECHGWDYKGAAGAYGDGSHATGITGIRRLAGAETAEIIAILSGQLHGYGSDKLPDAAARARALFVSQGQIDNAEYIGPDGRIIGDAGHGKAMFQNQCAHCHGFDGRAMNFRSEESPEYLGAVAAENPAELLHIIRHGNPGAVMPAYLVFGMDDITAIAAYAQTLPTQ